MSHEQPRFRGAPVNAVAVGDFDRVDASSDPDAHLEWMRHQRRSNPYPALTALELREDWAVLDVGCGAGNDLEATQSQVRVAVGVDVSETMVAAAGVRAPLARFARGDAGGLPFADEAFDAAWSRAVLIHSPNPEVVVGELRRVIRPGGRVALSEPDHGTHVVATDQNDVFERLKRHRHSRFRQPFVGRTLPVLAAGAGLEVVQSWVTPILHRSLATARAAGGPFDRALADAIDDGAISDAEAEAYIRSLETADANGAFMFAGLAMSVLARRRV